MHTFSEQKCRLFCLMTSFGKYSEKMREADIERERERVREYAVWGR